MAARMEKTRHAGIYKRRGYAPARPLEGRR